MIKKILVPFAGMLLLMAGCAGPKHTASTPTLEQTIPVFEPIAGEYHSMRIPALVTTQKGTLLAFCEGRIKNASDWGDINLLTRRSTDGGRTWSPIKVLSTVGLNGNPTPIVGNDGTIHLIFQKNYAEGFYMQSKDDGQTWSTPENITAAYNKFKPEYPWLVLAPGPGHAIQLKSGRLVVPVWLAASEKPRAHHPSAIATIYSDDNGKTWDRGAIIANNSSEFRNPSETVAAQLGDGRVMVNIRHTTAVRRRGISFSEDGISNWTKPVFDTALFEPICMAGLLRTSAHGKPVMVFTNPDSYHLPKHPRKNLTAKFSYDDGRTWTHKQVLDTSGTAYSDLAPGPGNTVYCLYESNIIGKPYRIVLKQITVPKK